MTIVIPDRTTFQTEVLNLLFDGMMWERFQDLLIRSGFKFQHDQGNWKAKEFSHVDFFVGNEAQFCTLTRQSAPVTKRRVDMAIHKSYDYEAFYNTLSTKTTTVLKMFQHDGADGPFQ